MEILCNLQKTTIALLLVSCPSAWAEERTLAEHTHKQDVKTPLQDPFQRGEDCQRALSSFRTLKTPWGERDTFLGQGLSCANVTSNVP